MKRKLKLTYGTFTDFISANSFDPHETSVARAVIPLSGTFNEEMKKGSGRKAPDELIGVELTFLGRKPNRLNEVTRDMLSSFRLVRITNEGTYVYEDASDFLRQVSFPVKADWIKRVKLGDLKRWCHFKVGSTEYVLQDYTDGRGNLLKCRNMRTLADAKFDKMIEVEQLP